MVIGLKEHVIAKFLHKASQPEITVSNSNSSAKSILISATCQSLPSFCVAFDFKLLIPTLCSAKKLVIWRMVPELSGPSNTT